MNVVFSMGLDYVEQLFSSEDILRERFVMNDVILVERRLFSYNL